jgi:hypothetical protein
MQWLFAQRLCTPLGPTQGNCLTHCLWFSRQRKRTVKTSQNPLRRTREMQRIQYFCMCTFCVCVLLVAGCGANPILIGGTTPPVTNPPAPTPPATPSSVTEPSVYVMGGSTGPAVLVFPQTVSGTTKGTLEIPGGQDSLDGAGNMYVLAGSSINEYSASALNGTPTRSLP